jgi:hypothetical protein
MTWEIQQPGGSTWNTEPGALVGWPKIDPEVDQTLWDLEIGILTVWDGNQGGTRWDLGPSINDQWRKVNI